MGRQLREALELLGIPAGSDHERVTRAYRRLARVTHPDISADPDAAERFAMVSAAYRLAAASFEPAQDEGRMEAFESGGRPPPRPPHDDRDNIEDYVLIATPDRAWSELPPLVSPYLPGGLWDRSSIVAGPVMIRQAPDDVGGSAV